MTTTEIKAKLKTRTEAIDFWRSFLAGPRTYHDWERARYLQRNSATCVLVMFPGLLVDFDKWDNDPFLQTHMSKMNRALEDKDELKLVSALSNLNLHYCFNDDEL